MRGYVHSILSLDKRDRFTNPALAYEWAKPQARIHINGGTRDSREKWVAPLAALFGKRRPYYVKPKESETTITGSYVPTPDPVIPTPVTPGQIRIACAQLFTTFTILTYVKNSYINITAPLANGFNYFFISIPKGNVLEVRNSLFMDISSHFIKIGDDIQVGYLENDLYRMDVQFLTSVNNTFTIKLN